MSKKTNNLTPKILALLFAIFLWFYVMGIENPERSSEIRNIDVILENTAELKRQGLVVMEPTNFKVTVTITGKQKEITKVKAKNIVAQADVLGYGEGQQKVGVTATIEGSSANVKVTNIEPREIALSLDKIITKEKPINVVAEGNVAEGNVVEELSSKPQTILISGPRTWVNQVSEARVVANMEGRSSSTSLTLPIQLLDDQGKDVRGLDKDPTMVDVSIEILKKKTLAIKLQTKGRLPDNYNINALKVIPETVTVKGDSSINSLELINTKPIDINQLINNRVTEVELDLPENVMLVNPNEKFTINYEIDEIISKDFEVNPSLIEQRNLDANLKTEEITSKILVKFKGAKKLLDSLSVDNIKGFVDLKDLGEGVHQVAINIEKIENLSLELITPPKIEIRLITKE